MTPKRGQGSTLARCAGAALLLAVSPAGADETLRCGSRVVSVGQATDAVQAACGEASLIDRWPVSMPPFGPSAGGIEVWTYNFGPNRLLWLLRFDAGLLRTIDSEGYGFRVPPEPRCEAQDIVRGMSKYRLLAYCGEPLRSRAYSALVPDRPSDGSSPNATGLYRATYREEWTYNFGSTPVSQQVVLDNARVVEVRDDQPSSDTP